jgi:hypothetical protein
MATFASLAPGASPAQPRTLTNEEVVRMTARGMQPAEIIREIRSAPSTSFDLDPEVIAEMRAVGVAEAVIEVMAEVDRASSPATQPAVGAEADGTIDLSFEGGPPPGEGRGLAIPSIEVAFYLICLDPTHVPDYWLTRTPLGEEFPRHHLLWFQEAPERRGRGGRGKKTQVLLPGRVTIRGAAGTHPIEVGVAVRDNEKAWKPLAASRAVLELKPGEVARLVVRAVVKKRRGASPVTLEIVEPAQPPAPVPAPIKR